MEKENDGCVVRQEGKREFSRRIERGTGGTGEGRGEDEQARYKVPSTRDGVPVQGGATEGVRRDVRTTALHCKAHSSRLTAPYCGRVGGHPDSRDEKPVADLTREKEGDADKGERKKGRPAWEKMCEKRNEIS